MLTIVIIILHVCSSDLEKAQKEFKEARLELQKEIENNDKEGATEMKSVVVAMEVNLREKQKGVTAAIERLGDADVLLQRAKRIKTQQDVLLPLFLKTAEGGMSAFNPHSFGSGKSDQSIDKSNAATAAVELPSECPLNLMLIALIVLSKGTFDQKWKLFMQIYHQDIRGASSSSSSNNNTVTQQALGALLFSRKFLETIVGTFHLMFFRLKYLPFPPYMDEIENTCYRLMLDCNADPVNNESRLTSFEMRRAVFESSHYACIGH